MLEVVSDDVSMSTDRDDVDEVPPASVDASSFDGGHDLFGEDHVRRVAEETRLTSEQEW
nr:hypothetical protein [Micromonospora sp. DSM 115978]